MKNIPKRESYANPMLIFPSQKQAKAWISSNKKQSLIKFLRKVKKLKIIFFTIFIYFTYELLKSSFIKEKNENNWYNSLKKVKKIFLDISNH